MSQAPKQIEDATNSIVNAWTTLAPAAVFGGMTLAQYKTTVKPSFDARATLANLDAQMTAALDERDNADTATADANQKVVKGVVGDPAFGDNSDLYDAMGYVRKSDRASGLTKKSKAAPAPKKV